MQRWYFVYILSSKTKRLYIGVTNDLDRLVYYEESDDVWAALNREKQLKGWMRARKLELVSDMNPEWHDLAAAWAI